MNRGVAGTYVAQSARAVDRFPRSIARREECSRRDLNPCQKLERLLSLTGLDYGSARGASPDLPIKLPSARAGGTVFKAQLSLALLWNSSIVLRAITSGSSRGSSGRDAIRAARTP